ncbi:hypothetical protein F5Y15DRAFT_428863 [Xylariaceae sp. FL0016]|nr:hypothetical protein F5Y15DRAFT_428863 [Xylariaceae sp. FL0016]
MSVKSQKSNAPQSSTQTRLHQTLRNTPILAEKEVRLIHSFKLDNLDLAAAELAPLYGLGPSTDPVARNKAQAVFVSPEIREPLAEFATHYLAGRWALPVGDWHAAMALVRRHRNDRAWTSQGEWRCPVREGSSDANAHYARFLLRALHAIRATSTQKRKKKAEILGWLRDADDEEALWVLFHALVYLQLDIMRCNRHLASWRDVAAHYVSRLAVEGSMLERLRCSKLSRGRER